MTSPSVNPDIEAQTGGVTVAQPSIDDVLLPRNTSDTRPSTNTNTQRRVTNTNGHHNGNAPHDAPARQTAAVNSAVQRDENHRDPSDGIWSMYLTEAEKQDTQVTEGWKEDIDGVLVFTGLFSATIATFVVESYKLLSPDTGETTNALLAQISVQLVNISNGTPLASVAVQSGQPFKPTASAIRVNLLWFISLILVLNCALSATTMQQWSRRYRELAQRRGATHRRGRIRAFMFDGIIKFGMPRALATMPTLLHVSVFLFFAGLVEFLFPIYTPIAYATLGCITVFALAYANLTVLPNIYPNSPYATPLSGLTWRISQLSMLVFLRTILIIEGLFRKPLSNLQSLGLRVWRKRLEDQIVIRRQWVSQSLQKTVELSAYEADPMVVASALAWTSAVLDQDQEIEDFAARVPGFFDSRVVPHPTLAVLPLMSHQSNTDPIFGSRLYDLLKTCIPETSILDERKRKNRLRICMKCLWHFGRAYNQDGGSQPLPSYFLDALASPAITRLVRAEEDSGVRVVGRCFGALIVNKLAAGIDSLARTEDSINDKELAYLSDILATERHDVKLLLSRPGAIVIANMISFKFDEDSTLVADTIPSDVLDMVQQTLGVLSQDFPAQDSAGPPSDQANSMTTGREFERVLLYRLSDLLKTCMVMGLPLTEEARKCCLWTCLKGFWYLIRAFNKIENSAALLFDICIVISNLERAGRVGEQDDHSFHMIQHCIGALAVNELAADIPVDVTGLTCLSSVLGIENRDVLRLLNHPGAIQIVNVIFLATDGIFVFPFNDATSGVLDVVQVIRQTFNTLSQAIRAQYAEEMRQDLTDISMEFSEGVSSLSYVMRRRVLCTCLKTLWHLTRAYIERGNSVPLPSYLYIAFTHPAIARRIRKEGHFAAQVVSRCVGALVVNKLATDINARDDEALACLSSILGSEVYDVELCLTQPAALELFNMAPFVLGSFGYLKVDDVPPDSSDILQQTLGILSQALPDQAELQPDQAVALSNVSNGTLERIIVSRLHGLLKICIPGTSTLTEEVRASCLRMSLKTLWYSSKAYHHSSDPLPSYFPLMLASPEFTHHFQNERDPISRMTGCCFRALIICKLVDDFTSPILLGGHVENAELACISAILGTRHRELSPHQLRIINFRKVVSLMSDEIDILFTTEGTPAGMLDIAQDTLYILVSRLRDRFKLEDVHHVPMDQRALLLNIYREVQNAVRSDSNRLKVQTVETLDRLRQMLEKLLSAMGLSQDTATQDLDH